MRLIMGVLCEGLRDRCILLISARASVINRVFANEYCANAKGAAKNKQERRRRGIGQ